MDRIDIWQEGEYEYPMAFGFRPNLRAYLIDDGETHPCMMVLPGGGYAVVVPPEGELVAKRFNELGYNCFVMTYTTNQLERAPVMDQAMRDLARAVRFVRKNAGKYRIDPSKLCVCGFSAAGHVCASVCDYWDEITDSNPEYKNISCRPDAAILSYPVITSGEHAHRDSFRFLLGNDIYDREDEEAKYLLDRYSLEKHVKSTNPPCFVWQTEEDNLVPVKNSYLYADALKAAGVTYEHITYPHGFHGLSIPNEAWITGKHGEPYTAEQSFAIVNAIREGLVEVPEKSIDSFLAFLMPVPSQAKPEVVPAYFKDICVWPELADRFIRKVFEA